MRKANAGRRFAAAVGLLVGLVGGVLIYFTLRAPFEVRAYDRIRLGMTRADVIATIGQPPGNFSRRPRPTIVQVVPDPVRATVANRGAPAADGATERWRWTDYEIAVSFDPKGRAVGVNLEQLWDRTPPPGLFERVRRWLGL